MSKSRPVKQGLSFWLLTLSLSVACFPQAGLNQAPAPRSLQVGIQRTQAELQQIYGMIQENRSDMRGILAGMGVDMTGLVAGARTTPSGTQIANAIKGLTDLLGTATDIYGKATAPSSLEISADLQLLLDGYGALELPGSKEIGVANLTTDIAVKVAQLTALYIQTQQLEKVQTKLGEALDELLSKDPVTRARIDAAREKALQELEAQQRRNAELLRQYFKDRPDVTRLMIQTPSGRGQQADLQINSGLRIVDPDQSLWDLSKIPGINPDFIAAMNCERNGLMKLLNGEEPIGGPACPRCRAGDPCDRYADGSYIPAFGPARGTKAIAAFQEVDGGGSPAGGATQNGQPPAAAQIGNASSGNTAPEPSSPSGTTNGQTLPSPAPTASRAGRSDGTIFVLSATYGPSCRVPNGNDTTNLANQCNGRRRCTYYVSNNRPGGDPAFGCPKDYVATYRCSQRRGVQRVSHRPVFMEGYNITLACRQSGNAGSH